VCGRSQPCRSLWCWGLLSCANKTSLIQVRVHRYQQIADSLRRRLEAGELATGGLLPSEADLVEHYGARRVTVRRALAALRETLARVERGEIADFRMIIRGVQRATHSDAVAHSGRAHELRKHGFCILPYHKNGAKPGDVWRITPEDAWRTDGHYAVFPLALCRVPILATCPPGGIVLDPFAGTGTTLVAARDLGRRAIGIDLSPAYLDLARQRLADTAPGLAAPLA